MAGHELYFLIVHSLSNLLAGAYVVWVFEDLCARVLSPLLEKLFRVLEAGLLLYLLLRVVSVSIFSTHVNLYRACWYGWYPCFFTATFASLSITWLLDKDISLIKLPTWLKGLAAINILCSLIVLTNDYHNLCFSFTPKYGNDVFFIHNEVLIGPVKGLIAGQYAFVFLRLLYLASAAGHRHSKFLWPLTTLVLTAAFNYLYHLQIPFFYESEHVAINTCLTALFWQQAAKARLFPCYGYYTALEDKPSPGLVAEAIYHVRQQLMQKTQAVLQTETKSIAEAVTILQSSTTTNALRQTTLHRLKLILFFIKKHCLFFLQAEIKGSIHTKDYLAAMQESLRYVNEAGCNTCLLLCNYSEELPVKAMVLHNAWSHILQQILLKKPEVIIFNLREQQNQLKLTCTTSLNNKSMLEKLSVELQEQYALSCSHHATEDAAFLSITAKEVSHE